MIIAVRNLFDRAQQDKLENAVLVILLFSSAPQEIKDHHYTKFCDKCFAICS